MNNFNFNPKQYWQPLSLPIKIAVIALAVIALAVLFSSIAGDIQRRNYEAEIQGLKTTTREAMAKAGAEADRAIAADAQVQILTAELAKTEQQLLDANAELVDAQNATSQTRRIYLEKKIPVSVPVYLTGNPTTDSRALCAKLAADGFPCER